MGCGAHPGFHLVDCVPQSPRARRRMRVSMGLGTGGISRSEATTEAGRTRRIDHQRTLPTLPTTPAASPRNSGAVSSLVSERIGRANHSTDPLKPTPIRIWIHE